MSRNCVAAAVAVACLVSFEGEGVKAQEAPTPGGDVTAEDASVLPPVVVNSPTQPISRPAKRKPAAQDTSTPEGGTGKNATSTASGAGTGTPAIATGVFTLGQIDMIGGST
nr:hypothetical protein [Hyphomicrobium sp.]